MNRKNVCLGLVASVLAVTGAVTTFVGNNSPAQANNATQYEVCVPSIPLELPDFLPEGELTGGVEGVQEISVENGQVSVVVLAGKCKAGSYEAVYVRNGEIVMTKGDPAPDPHAGCTTTVTIDGNRATIKCTKISCNTHCALNSFVDVNGVTSYCCQCNLPVPGTPN